VHCVHVQNPALARDEFVEMLAVRFKLSDRAVDRKPRSCSSWKTCCAAATQAGESTVLVVDEAQSLPRDILEEIRYSRTSKPTSGSSCP
jgi:hypothetical protein